AVVNGPDTRVAVAPETWAVQRRNSALDHARPASPDSKTRRRVSAPCCLEDGLLSEDRQQDPVVARLDAIDHEPVSGLDVRFVVKRVEMSEVEVEVAGVAIAFETGIAAKQTGPVQGNVRVAQRPPRVCARAH